MTQERTWANHSVEVKELENVLGLQAKFLHSAKWRNVVICMLCSGMWVLELLSHLYETLTNRRVWPKRTTRNDLALYSLWGSQLEAPPTSGFQWSSVCCVGMWVLELLSHLWHWQTGGFGPRGPQEMIWHCIASGEVNLRLPLPRAFSQVCFW